MDGIEGRGFPGASGWLVEAGWGATLGYPALVLDPAGQEVEVNVVESPNLPERWARLHAFEGSGYVRLETRVWTESR